IGGAIIGSVGTFLTGGAPLSAIARIAQSLKIWAVVCAIGGTFDAIETFQKGLLAGSTMDLFKQFMLIISAMIGVRTALLRSEEHTSELQSRFDLVCRLLLEKKKNNKYK